MGETTDCFSIGGSGTEPLHALRTHSQGGGGFWLALPADPTHYFQKSSEDDGINTDREKMVQQKFIFSLALTGSCQQRASLASKNLARIKSQRKGHTKIPAN